MIDDTYEYGPVEELNIIWKKALAILRGQTEKDDDPKYQQLFILRRELLSFADNAWLQRFCGSLDVYFEGIIREIPYRINMVFPSFEEFYTIREKAVNVFPLVDLAEAITGQILPETIIKSPVLQRLAQLTCRILAWSNDYFSAPHEKGSDVFNLVLMLENQHHYPMEEAYRDALRIHDADVREFCMLSDASPDFGQYDVPVKTFIENLALMIHGYLYWTNLLTKRYQSGGHPSIDLKMNTR